MMNIDRRRIVRKGCKSVSKSYHRCTGGPYDKQLLLLSTPGTLAFRLGKFSGRYNEEMQWVSA